MLVSTKVRIALSKFISKKFMNKDIRDTTKSLIVNINIIIAAEEEVNKFMAVGKYLAARDPLQELIDNLNVATKRYEWLAANSNISEFVGKDVTSFLNTARIFSKAAKSSILFEQRLNQKAHAAGLPRIVGPKEAPPKPRIVTPKEAVETIKRLQELREDVEDDKKSLLEQLKIMYKNMPKEFRFSYRNIMRQILETEKELSEIHKRLEKGIKHRKPVKVEWED